MQQFLIDNPDGTATRLGAATASATTTGSNPVDFGTGAAGSSIFPDSGERVNIDAKLVLGTLLVPTIVPSRHRVLARRQRLAQLLRLPDGRRRHAVGNRFGKYDSTIVGVNVLFIDGNPVVEVVTSTNPTPKIDPNVEFKATAAGFTGKRVLWRELIPQD